MNTPQDATPHSVLIQELRCPHTPKTEREYAAAAEIRKLEKINEKLMASVLDLLSLASNQNKVPQTSDAEKRLQAVKKLKRLYP